MSNLQKPDSLPELSFEFFPPKDDAGIDRLLAGTVKRLKAFKPRYCSVTYGAGGSTKAGTQALVERLIASGTNAVPHLSIGGSSEEELAQLIGHYQSIGVTKILCLRGDHSSAETYKKAYAEDLVTHLSTHWPNQFELSVAAYPEIHPDSGSVAADLKYFAAKVNAGASSAITQYFYNAEAYGYFADRCEKAGLTIPIAVGIMPITNIDALHRFSAKAGADVPRWLGKSMSSYVDDEKGLIAYGVEVVTKLCERLQQLGAPGLHFYTLNRWGASRQICLNLGFLEH